MAQYTQLSRGGAASLGVASAGVTSGAEGHAAGVDSAMPPSREPDVQLWNQHYASLPLRQSGRGAKPKLTSSDEAGKTSGPGCKLGLLSRLGLTKRRVCRLA